MCLHNVVCRNKYLLGKLIIIIVTGPKLHPNKSQWLHKMCLHHVVCRNKYLICKLIIIIVTGPKLHPNKSQWLQRNETVHKSNKEMISNIILKCHNLYMSTYIFQDRGRRGRDRIVVGFKIFSDIIVRTFNI